MSVQSFFVVQQFRSHFISVVTHCFCSCSTVGLVSTLMGYHLWPDKPSWYVTSLQPGHPSVSRHDEYQWKLGSEEAFCPVFMVWQCKLMFGWGLQKRSSVQPTWLWKDFTFCSSLYVEFCFLSFFLNSCRLLSFNVTLSTLLCNFQHLRFSLWTYLVSLNRSNLCYV